MLTNIIAAKMRTGKFKELGPIFDHALNLPADHTRDQILNSYCFELIAKESMDEAAQTHASVNYGLLSTFHQAGWKILNHAFSASANPEKRDEEMKALTALLKKERSEKCDLTLKNFALAASKVLHVGNDKVPFSLKPAWIKYTFSQLHRDYGAFVSQKLFPATVCIAVIWRLYKYIERTF